MVLNTLLALNLVVLVLVVGWSMRMAPDWSSASGTRD